jgi:zinc protease
MIPMMKQYLAVLPSLRRTEQGDSSQALKFRRGRYASHFRRDIETPKATLFNLYSGQMEYSARNLLAASMLKQILDLVYMEKIRENESGSYSVRTSIGISGFPEGQTVLQIFFDTDPAMKDKLLTIVNNELQEIVNNGPREIDFTKTRDNMLKRHDEALQENSYWLGTLDEYYFRGRDYHSRYKETLDQVTPSVVQTFARELIGQGNHIEVIMEPEK